MASEAVELIKQRINIVDLIGRFVNLKQVGGRFVAPCPFHQETQPSFSVNPDEGFFYCFGCQKYGDIFNFWMEYHGVTFRDALEALAIEAGVQLEAFKRNPKAAAYKKEQRTKRQLIMQMYELAQTMYRKNLAGPAGENCRAYMRSRGIPEKLAERFGLGWALDNWQGLTNYLKANGCDLNLAMEGGLLGKSSKTGTPYDPFRARLMFPIRSIAGETIAFGGRIIESSEDTAKYVNSSDSPIYKKGEHLYGLDVASPSIRVKKQVFLTEGYMDVLTLHQFGYTNAIGGLGTALTDQQVNRIIGYTPEVMLLYDGDGAGRKAALAAATKFLEQGAKTRVILQPEGEDIDSLLRSKGPEAFDAICEKAVPALQFCADTMRDRAPAEAIKWCRAFLCNLTKKIPERINPAIQYLTRRIGFDEKLLREETAEELNQQLEAPAPNSPRQLKPVTAPLQLSALEKEILRVAVRFPEQITRIRDMGADLFLQSMPARKLWNRILASPGEEASYEMDEAERLFWDKYRGLEAAPRTDPEIELTALSNKLDRLSRKMQTNSLSAVLRHTDTTGDIASGIEYLGAFQNAGSKAED